MPVLTSTRPPPRRSTRSTATSRSSACPVPAEKRPEARAGETVSHPLDPLTAQEIAAASSIVRRERRLGSRVRFETVVLKEPDKDEVLSFRPGDPIRRTAFLVILDNEDGATYEAMVSLDKERVTGWKHVPGVQPRIMFDEFSECEAAVRANPEFRAALRKRGISDPDLVMVDPVVGGELRVSR